MTAHDVRAVISAYLLTSGVLGRKENEILRRFKYIPKEEILMELQVLWEQQRVQRFTINGKQVWRATELMNV